MKAFTDIGQSKKLAEILLIDSADMRYGYIAPYEFSDRKYDGGYDMIPYHKDFFDRCSNFSADEYDDELPCWSLAALLDILPEGTRLLKSATDDTYHCDCPKGNIEKWFDNPVDACYEMILKLNEEKLL